MSIYVCIACIVMSICLLWLFLGESLISGQVFQIWLCICDRRDLIRLRRLEIIPHTFHHCNVDLFYFICVDMNLRKSVQMLKVRFERRKRMKERMDGYDEKSVYIQTYVSMHAHKLYVEI